MIISNINKPPFCRGYVCTELHHDAMLKTPPDCWDSEKHGPAKWEMLVESYCYSDPDKEDFSVPSRDAQRTQAAGKVGLPVQASFCLDLN
jgi:hypothetical protein